MSSNSWESDAQTGRAQRARHKLRPLISRLMFERRLGVDTSRSVDTDSLAYDDDRYTFYEPAEWRTLERVLPRRSVGPDDVFIDIGSGMGRMVLRAARYPFKRVIGVELSPELHEVALDNLEASRDRLRCKDVHFEQANATEYELPDDVTVVFLNNPFGGRSSTSRSSRCCARSTATRGRCGSSTATRSSTSA